jgi:hypothetical protein
MALKNALDILCVYSILEKSNQTYYFIARSFPEILLKTQMCHI